MGCFGSLRTFARRRRRSGIIERISSSRPKHNSRSSASSTTPLRGFGMTVVHGAADLIGKTLGESGLWDRDITVLTLHRGTTVIPNPRKGVVLESEDRLLCFGRLEEMRSMIPERRRRRARVRKLPKEPIPEG